MPKLQVGDTAPDFEMVDQDGKTVRLGDFRGQKSVVLIFYPGDQTPGCTKQLCTARNDAKMYEDANAVSFGVNQGSEESHKKFVDKHGLTTDLLVDKGLKTANDYDAVMGFGPVKIINRTVVAIDPRGKIVYYKRGMPSTAEILSSLKSPVA